MYERNDYIVIKAISLFSVSKFALFPLVINLTANIFVCMAVSVKYSYSPYVNPGLQIRCIVIQELSQ